MLFQALPYVLTLIAVAGRRGRPRPPAAVGIPYVRNASASPSLGSNMEAPAGHGWVDMTDRRGRFHALFDAHRADVVAYCRWRAASHGDAEDAVAEVFLMPGAASTTSPMVRTPACGSTRRRGGRSPTSAAPGWAASR